MTFHAHSDFPVAPLFAVLVVGIILVGVIYTFIAERKRRAACRT